MTRVVIIAFLMLGLGGIAPPGIAAQGTASGTMASAERTVKNAGATATREVTDSWLTLQTKLALLADERVSSTDVHVTTQRGVITLRGKVDSEAEQQAAGEIARTIEDAREVNN
jgi:hyperosmotically inducible periplasmic protein